MSRLDFFPPLPKARQDDAPAARRARPKTPKCEEDREQKTFTFRDYGSLKVTLLRLNLR